MGKFAEAAAKHSTDRRTDGCCVAGKWIEENLDKDDLEEFIRLVNAHKWDLIVRLSGNELRRASLQRHVHGSCPCFDSVVAKASCSCDKTVVND